MRKLTLLAAAAILAIPTQILAQAQNADLLKEWPVERGGRPVEAAD